MITLNYVLGILYFCSYIFCSNILTKNENLNEISVKFYEIKYEPMGSDGKYSETFLNQSSEVVDHYFKTHSSVLYQSPAHSFEIFSNSFDCFFSSFQLDSNSDFLKLAILSRLFTKYHNLCLNYNASEKVLNPGSVEFKDREEISLCVVILAQEVKLFDFEIPKDLAPTLLEFILRFSVESTRVELAFEILLDLLSLEQKKLVFQKILIYFDPERPAAPVVYLTNDGTDPAVKPVYVDFIRNLYLRVSAIDSDKNFDIHAQMLVRSMFSCFFFQEYETMILDLVSRIEIFELGVRPMYSSSVIEIISKLSFVRNNFAILDVVCDKLFKNDFIISNHTESFSKMTYVDFSTIFESIFKMHPLRYQKHKSLLSAEACTILTKIEENSKKFDKLEICRSEIFKNIRKTNFSNLDSSKLSTIKCQLIELISEYHQYANHRCFEAIVFSKAAGEILVEIIKESVENSKSFSAEIINQRFQIFFEVLQLIYITKITQNFFPHVFLGVIFFYNSNFTSITLDLSYRQVIKNIADVVMINNFFLFKSIKHHYILLQFFVKCNNSLLLGEKTMLYIYQNLLMKSVSKVYSSRIILSIASGIEIEINEILKNCLNDLINEYLKNYSNIPIEFYSNKSIIEIIRLMHSYKILSKTELEVLNVFVKRYALDKNINFY